MAGELFLAGTSLAADQDRHLACRAFTGAKKRPEPRGYSERRTAVPCSSTRIGDMPGDAASRPAALPGRLDRAPGGRRQNARSMSLLVSATNADLGEINCKRGRFRSDLLFRLNTLEGDITGPCVNARILPRLRAI